MMNSLHSLGIALVACASLIPSLALGQNSDHDGCSNETLKGDYAFRISGNILNSAGTPIINREGVAMTHFDGKGGLTQVDFVMANGLAQPGPADPVTEFHIDEWGTYTVNSDCTGSAVIHFPAPPHETYGAEIDLKFVLSQAGRTIHTIVTKLIPPYTTKPVPVPVSIHSDAEKLELVR
ncbi:MAG: hypothetical protein JO033_24660 [Acidobacteriaceae bacterium]|nr:hypothetical protein [Acidobacteriaceae bacterium]MBV9502195.1 hypothetical protein [Acidobacteriaceae bacterium]